MPRFQRIVVPGVPLHLIQRGINRSTAFHAAEDFERYKAVLRETCRRYGCSIHAYVLMSNHVHLLLTPSDECGPSRMMQAVGRVYVRYFNSRYRRTGTLWEGRYRSTSVDSDNYLLACSRYIELNPVRARMVEHPSQYRWSSYRHNAQGEPDALVTQHTLYTALDKSAAIRESLYKALLEAPLEVDALDAIRLATNRGTALGDVGFCERLEGNLKRAVTLLPHGGDRRSQSAAVNLRTKSPEVRGNGGSRGQSC